MARGFGGFRPWIFGFISWGRSSQPQKFTMKDLCHGGREAERGVGYREKPRKIKALGTQPL